MPIVNLTKTSEVGSGLPIIGKLHKGDKKTENNRPGKDLDYFRMEFSPEFADLKEDWEALYGEEPDGFNNVFMAHATVDDAFSSWKEEWNASQTLLHRCDGEHQVLWYSQSAQAYSTAKESCASVTSATGPCACKNVGRLNLLLMDFIGETGIMGYVTVETHSINDILTIYRTLADVQRINGGTLLGIPFILGRATKKISAPDAKNHRRIKVNKSLFYLHVDPDFTRETLLPRLAQSGAFFSANQPMLSAPTPQLPSIENAKGLLGTGDGIRRLGAVTAPPAEIVPPAGPTPPTPVVATVATTPAPQPEQKPAEQSMVGIDTVGNAIGKLKTRALKELFGGKEARAMNECVSRLMQEGKLPPAMSIDEAFQVIKSANCPQSAPTSTNETVVDMDFEAIPSAFDKTAQPVMPGMPAVVLPV